MSKLMLFTMAIVTTLILSPYSYVKTSEIPRSTAALQQLDKKSGGTLDVIWNEQTNTPARLSGRLTMPSKHSPAWIAYKFLEQVKYIYGLQDSGRDMKVVEIERSPDLVKIRLQHLLFSTPVWGNELVIEMDHDGVIWRVEGTIHPNLEKQLFNRPLHAAITKKEAIQKAIAGTQGQLQNEPEVSNYYLPSRLGTSLIYVVNLKYNTSDMATTTLVHSLSGRVIEQY